MQRSTEGERRTSAFSIAARAAIEKHVPEARTAAARWHFGPGSVWVIWTREGGDAFALGLRRHLDWVTGEAALGRGAMDPDKLPLTTGGDDDANSATGYRVRLGVLLHDEDRWWPAGSTPEELKERLEWLVIQLRVKAESHVGRHPLAG
jgi:hypothetical protein